MGGFNLTCCNQQVVVGDNADQLACCNVIGLKPQRVDHDLKHLIALTGQTGLKHGVKPFDAVLQIFGDAQQGPFRYLACQVDDDDGEFGKVDFVDGVLIRACGKLRLGVVHGRTDIGKDLGFVPAEFKFKRDTGIAFGRGGGHGFQPVQIRQFGLHRFDKQGFTVFG